LAELARREGIELVGVVPPGPLDREIPVPAWIRPDRLSRARHYEELLERLQPDVVLMSHVAHTIGVTHARLGSPAPALGVIHSWHNVTTVEGAERQRALELSGEAVSGLDAAVTPSRHVLAEGRRLGFEYPPISDTIHNPVPPLFMDDGLDVGRRGRDGVIYLGSLIPRKRPVALVQAVGLLRGVGAQLIGNGELEAELRSEIAALGLEERVRLAEAPIGDVHLPWIRDALLAGKVMCLPSSSEGLPLAFVEALACGTPIIGFGPAVREIREELGIEVGIPLTGDTSDELAAAIERVVATDWDRDELRRATLARFGLDRVTDRYVQLFERLVERPSEAVSGSAARVGRPAPRRELTGRAICVLGPPRSGTSLTARLLDLAGVHLGPREELLGEERRQLFTEGEAVMARAEYSNPGGHWEHYRLMRLNERLLRTLGGNWRELPLLPPGWELATELDELREEAQVILAESFASRQLWGWKDPRNSLTLPFWRRLLPETRYVICVRNPVEVAQSLQRRDGIPLADGVRLWQAYLAAAFLNTSGRPRLIVAYEDYFKYPVGVGASLARFIGRGTSLRDLEAKRWPSEAIDERLRRNRVSDRNAAESGIISREVASLYRTAKWLVIAARDGIGGAVLADLDTAVDQQAEDILGHSV
jgi:glycosyltransferase involved in cell wall biosynthesis